MKRRTLLKLALVLPLAGCGGGNKNNPVPTHPIAGRVIFPAGVPLTLSSLKVETALGAVPIYSDGSCQIPTSPTATGPTLAWVRSESAVLYLGFVTEGDATIDAVSTAVALLYLSLGGFQAEEASKSILLSGLRKHAATTTLSQVITARVTALPTALVEGDAALGAALKTAHDTLVAELNTVGRVVATPQASRSRATTTASLLLEPATAQSNVRVDQTTAPQTFIATNQARRYCQVMTYEINRENKNGQRANPAKARLVSSVWLPSTPALGFKDTATGFFTHKTAFTPVSTDPITLSMNDGDAKTFFEVVVLGSSSLIGDPPIYSEPRYASEVGTWREIRADLNLSSWVADVLLGLLLELWGLRDFVAQKGAIREAVQKFRRDYAVIETRLFIAADAGDLSGALAEVLRLLATNPAFVEYMVSLSITLSPNLKSYLFADTVKNSTTLVAKSLMAVLNVAGLILGAGDLGAVLIDLAGSQQVDRWSATLVTSEVTLSPGTATIAPGDSLALSARLPNATGANLVYKWSLTGSNLANLSDAKEGKAGVSFETSGATVNLATTPSTQGVLTVTVEAFEIPTSGERVSRGTASATVTVEEEKVPFGSVLVKLSNPPGGGLDPTLKRLLSRIRVQVVSSTSAYIEPVWELYGLGGEKQTILFMDLDFGSSVKKNQTVSLAKTDKLAPVFMRLAGPTTGGAIVNFLASSGTLKVIEVYEDGKSVPQHIQFTASAEFYAQDAPELRFTATMDGWMTNIRRWGDPPTS